MCNGSAVGVEKLAVNATRQDPKHIPCGSQQREIDLRAQLIMDQYVPSGIKLDSPDLSVLLLPNPVEATRMAHAGRICKGE